MPISSYVLRCPPADQAGVRQQLAGQPGLMVGESTDLGIPVAVEAASTRAAAELGDWLQNLPGVRSAVLVYHNFEDLAGDA